MADVVDKKKQERKKEIYHSVDVEPRRGRLHPETVWTLIWMIACRFRLKKKAQMFKCKMGDQLWVISRIFLFPP